MLADRVKLQHSCMSSPARYPPCANEESRTLPSFVKQETCLAANIVGKSRKFAEAEAEICGSYFFSGECLALNWSTNFWSQTIRPLAVLASLSCRTKSRIAREEMPNASAARD